MSTLEKQLEALERTISEIEVLQAIYGIIIDEDDVNNENDNNKEETKFIIHSKDELRIAQSLVNGNNDNDDDDDENENSNDNQKTDDEILNIISNLHFDIEIRFILNITRTSSTPTTNKDINGPILACLRCLLLPGYPDDVAAKIVSVSITTTTTTTASSSSSGHRLLLLKRKQQDELQRRINDKALSLIGQESIIMEIIQEIQNVSIELLEENDKDNDEAQQEQQQQQQGKVVSITNKNNSSSLAVTDNNDHNNYGRRWIWVHHITNKERIKSIVNEAISCNLGGYVKHGYPGIVVIEGLQNKCDEFVIWIKGNKSRPNGGFGRNWGHHVRGEINFTIITTATACEVENQQPYMNIKQQKERQKQQHDHDDDGGGQQQQQQHHQRRQLPLVFEQLDDNMATLGSKCKENGLENEFLEYVMRHR